MIKPLNIYLELNKFNSNLFLLLFSIVFFGKMNGHFTYNLNLKNDFSRFENLIIVEQSIAGFVKNERGELLEDVKVELAEENGNIVKTIYTSKTGDFYFEVTSNKIYHLIFSKLNYYNLKNIVSVDDLKNSQKITIKLKQLQVMSLYGLVVDAKNKKVLEGVKVTIIDKLTEKLVDVFVTSEAGDFIKLMLDKKVGDTLNYCVKLEKKNYVSKTIDFNYLINNVGEINMHETSNFNLSKL